MRSLVIQAYRIDGLVDLAMTVTLNNFRTRVCPVLLFTVLILCSASCDRSSGLADETNEISSIHQTNPVVQPDLRLDDGTPERISLQFVRIPAGTFRMGPNSNPGSPEVPMWREVTISRPFVMATTEVTVQQWIEVMGHTPKSWDELPDEAQERFAFPHDQPVVWVDLADAIRFTNALSRAEGLEECYEAIGCELYSRCERLTFRGLDCRGFRLPTEAEWEYAARASGDTFCVDSEHACLDRIAWYSDNAGGQVRPVAQLEPNSWGLYDMLGNVWEWTMDCYGSLLDTPAIDPIAFTIEHEDLTQSFRGNPIVRGGSVHFGPDIVTVSYRGVAGLPNDVGFRPVRTLSN